MSCGGGRGDLTHAAQPGQLVCRQRVAIPPRAEPALTQEPLWRRSGGSQGPLLHAIFQLQLQAPLATAGAGAGALPPRALPAAQAAAAAAAAATAAEEAALDELTMNQLIEGQLQGLEVAGIPAMPVSLPAMMCRLSAACVALCLGSH